MDLTGEYRIPATPQQVWDALVDAEVLKACITGCRELDKVSDTEFTTVVANKVGTFLADNEADLLGAESAQSCKRRFIALVNERATDYAEFRWTDEGPDYGFLRCFGHCVAATMSGHDQSWAVSQVIEAEAPAAVEMLQKAMAGLLDPAPPRARRAAGTPGE